MAMKVGELVQILRVDNKPHKRGLQEARADAEREGEKSGKGWADKFRKGMLTGLRRSLIYAVLAPFGAAMLAGAATVAAQFAAHFIAQTLTILGPGLAAIGLLVPAAIAGGVLAMGALKIALGGVGDAVKAGLSGDVAKLNEALKDMAPAAQEAVRSIVSLKPALDDLKKSVQASFFGEFANQIKPLATIYLPMLRTHLAYVAGILGHVVSQLAAFFDTPASARKLAALLGDLAAAVGNIAEGVPGIVSGLLTLVSVGASFLPNLTGGFKDLTDRFADWMGELQKSGALHDFIANGLSGLGDLIKVFGTLAGIVHTVFGAVIDAGLLDGLNVLGQAVKTLVREAGPGLKVLIGGLVAGLLAIAPAAGPVGKALGAVFTALAPLLPVIGELGNVLLTALADILRLVAVELGPIIGLFAEWATGVLPMLLPLFATFVEYLLPIAVDFFRQLWTALEPLIPQILELAKAFIEQLLPMLPDLIDAWKQMIPPLIQLAKELMPVFIEGIRLAIVVLPFLIPLLRMAITVFAAIVWVLALVLKAIDGFLWGIRQVSGAVGDFFRELRGIPGTIAQIFSSAGTWLLDIGSRIIGGLIQGLRNRLGDLRNLLGSITSMIPNWKGPLDTDRRLLMPSGSAIMGGLMAGIRGRLGDLRGTLGQVTATIAGTGGSVGVTGRTAGAGAAGGDPQQVTELRAIRDLLARLNLTVGPEGLALTVRKGEKSLRYAG